MKIAVLGNDRRFECLRSLLSAHILTGADEADMVITPWPAPQNVDFAKLIVTCGPKNGPAGAVDLLDDEDYQQEIAWMTAEGAVFSAMGAADSAINGAECMVVGFGRIGKALAERLAALGAQVTVLSRSPEKCPSVYIRANTSEAGEYISGKKFVFSTAPATVLDENTLGKADKETILIDLASPPYGFDIDAATKSGLKARREPGLPGRYCPENAARAIFHALIRHGLIEEGC